MPSNFLFAITIIASKERQAAKIGMPNTNNFSGKHLLTF
jgi:hypothetical protein